MLHLNERAVRNKMLFADFSISKNILYVNHDGFMAHDFVDERLVQANCENRLQISTSVWPSVDLAYKDLFGQTQKVQEILEKSSQMLWPFSNPPYIRDEQDIVVQKDCESCEYFARKYGRYKMTLCGVSLNFSFGEELLREDFALYDGHDFDYYKERVYLDLAKQLSVYGWLLTLLCSASPLSDSSYFQKGVYDEDVFGGIASLKNSQLGFWNHFTPEFEYTNLQSYVSSIEKFVEDDLILSADELFFPIRLMSANRPSFMALKEDGIDYIELSMFDLNPFDVAHIDVRDLEFAHLFIVWLCSFPSFWLDRKDSVQIVQNFKNAAHYDLKTVFVRSYQDRMITMLESALRMLEEVELFYEGEDAHILDVIAFEKQKCLDLKARYSYKVLQNFRGGFVKKGIVQAEKLQDDILKARG